MFFRLCLAFWRLFDRRPRCACGSLAPQLLTDDGKAICARCYLRARGL